MSRLFANRKNGERGEIMIEGMIVMVITMFILIWILGLGIVSPMLHRAEICRNLFS